MSVPFSFTVSYFLGPSLSSLSFFFFIFSFMCERSCERKRRKKEKEEKVNMKVEDEDGKDMSSWMESFLWLIIFLYLQSSFSLFFFLYYPPASTLSFSLSFLFTGKKKRRKEDREMRRADNFNHYELCLVETEGYGPHLIENHSEHDRSGGPSF